MNSKGSPTAARAAISRRCSLLAGLGAAIATAASAACGPSTRPAALSPARQQAPVTLSVMHWPLSPEVDQILQRRLQAVAQAHPALRFERQPKPHTEFRAAVIARNVGGDPLDLIAVDSYFGFPFAYKQQLGDLAPLVARDKPPFGRYYNGRGILREYEMGKLLFGFPDVAYTYVYLYNKALLDQAGARPPSPRWTWDDLLALSRQVAAPDAERWGFILSLHATSRFLPTLWQNGASLFDEQKTRIALDQPPAVEALLFFADLVARHRVAPLPGTQGASFGAGNVALEYGAAYGIVGASRQWDFPWGVVFPPQKRQRITCTTTDGWAIGAASRRTEEAWAAIRFLAGEQGQRPLPSGNLLSIMRDLNERYAYAEQPAAVRQVVFEAVQNSRGSEALGHPLIDEIRRRYNAELAKAYEGEQRVQEGMRKVAEEFNPRLREFAALFRG